MDAKVVGGHTEITIHGPGGPLSSYAVALKGKTKKIQIRPSATIVGVALDDERSVGWDGTTFHVKPKDTLDSLLADDLEPVGKARLVSTGRVPYAAKESIATKRDYTTVAQKRIADPGKYPHMIYQEVMVVLGLKKSSVYNHPRLELISTGTKKKLFSTKSVISILKSAPE